MNRKSRKSQPSSRSAESRRVRRIRRQYLRAAMIATDDRFPKDVRESAQAVVARLEKKVA